MLKTVEARFKAEQPSAIKIRWDGARGEIDRDIAGDIAKARAVRKLVGDGFLWRSTPTTATRSARRSGSGGCSRSSAIIWFEEPVEYYHPKAMGEVAQRLDITVSAGEQSYTLQSVATLIECGVRMVQPDIVKMGGVTGLMQCAAPLPRPRRRVRAAPDPARDRQRRQPARALDRHAGDQARRARRRLGARRQHLRQRPQARRRMPGRAGGTGAWPRGRRNDAGAPAFDVKG